jgi:hypothetical protein
MRSELEHISKYTASCEHLKIRNSQGDVIQKELYAAILLSGPPDPGSRQKVLERVLGQIDHEVLNPSLINVKFCGSVRAALCDFQESFSVDDPTPAARAKEVIRLPLKEGDVAKFDFYVKLEEELDRHLRSSGIGFVDGNDFGRGEICIYCFGPKKQELRGAIDQFLSARKSSL